MIDLQPCVERLSKEMGLPGPLGHEKSYNLLFGNNLKITIVSLGEGLIGLEGLIGHLPDKQVEDFLVYIAFANLFGEGTENAVISLDNEKQLLYLDRRLPLASYERFKEDVEMFVNYLELWQKKREDAGKEGASYRGGLLQSSS